VVIMTATFVRIKILTTGELAISTAQLSQAVRTLGKYPIALVACWAPHVLVVIVIDEMKMFPNDSSWFSGLNLISEMLKILHGGVTACIFFWHSPEARALWYGLLMKAQASRAGRSVGSLLNREAARDSTATVDPSSWGEEEFDLDYSIDYRTTEQGPRDSSILNLNSRLGLELPTTGALSTTYNPSFSAALSTYAPSFSSAIPISALPSPTSTEADDNL